MNRRALIINPADNVANLIGPGEAGDTVECTTEGKEGVTTVTLQESIPANHKIAPADIKAGDAIIKYGLNIGKATCDILTGKHVHIHNIESHRGRGDLQS